ncbi:hypothetical protein [Rhizobium laguerreae]|uniref:hypothetical protein n=1 Tax=Rhizobium laguerreae TaxID=1076926 RepID=UPI001C917237|nr:hypothetical protein [Rhizobium laguerreae]MBY3195166.1 DUF2971 domain-containing protein [Rhizobium laguerreae]
MEGHYIGLSNGELDQHIYRIMRQDYMVALFADRQNVLSQVQNWKDKFENFQLKLGGMLDGERFEYGFRDDFVGQCWTRESLSEAMWGIYANDPQVRFVRIRSTPRTLLRALVAAHPKMPQDTCFIGKVEYKREAAIEAYARNGGQFELQTRRFAESLLLKRHAFAHESEVRLLYFGDAKDYAANGLYRYAIDPHAMITQIMADPNRDRAKWLADKAYLQKATGFAGEIKRSKIYDPPEWDLPTFTS